MVCASTTSVPSRHRTSCGSPACRRPAPHPRAALRPPHALHAVHLLHGPRAVHLRGATRALLMLLLPLLLGAAAAVPAQEDSKADTVAWRGELCSLARLREERAATAAADLAARWIPFARALGYRLVLSEDTHVLLCLSDTYARTRQDREHREVGVMLGLVRDTAAVVGPFTSAAAMQRSVVTIGAHEQPSGATPSSGAAPPSNGAPPRSAATPPPVAIVCCRHRDYPRLLAHVATLDERLRPWAASAARSVCGFILSDPLIAAWIEDAPGVDEWHPHNELVHRTAQLLVRGRAPALPSWLLLGLAWHVEDTVRECIYCFPHRAGFVSAAAHTDWGLWLANHFKKERRRKAKLPTVLTAEEFVGWRPESDEEFESGKAYLAFGVARWLMCEHPDAVLPFAVELSAAAERGRRTWISATEWRTDPDYQVPVAAQLAALHRLDGQALGRITEWFRKKKANERKPGPGRR